MNQFAPGSIRLLLLAAVCAFVLSCSTPSPGARAVDAQSGTGGGLRSPTAPGLEPQQGPEEPPFIQPATPYPNFGSQAPAATLPSTGSPWPPAPLSPPGRPSVAPPFNSSGDAYQFPGNGPGATTFPGAGTGPFR